MAGISSALKSSTSIDPTLQNKITILLNRLNFTHDDSLLNPDSNLFKKIPEILELLQQLKQYLSEKSNDGSLFPDDMKNIYQLLDCLTQVNSFQLHSDINRLMIECILNTYDFGYFQPTRTRTTNPWVISKLRNCFLYVDTEGKYLHDHLGLHTELICEKAISVLREYIMDLKVSTDTVNGTPLPSGVIMSSASLSDVCSILVYLLHNSQQPRFQTLIDAFMDYLSTQPCSGVVSDFYQSLDSLESSRYTGNLISANPPSPRYLSFYSQSKLWINHMPSLEREVLLLIHASLDWCYCRKHMERIMNSRLLPKACAEDTQLFLETSSVFHSVIKNMIAMDEKNITGRRRFVGASIFNVLSVFYDCIHRHTTEYSSKEDSISLYCLYPSFLHEILKQYILIPYQDISECVKNMKSFFQLTEMWKCAGFDLVPIWFQTQHFRLKFIAYLLQHSFTVPEANLEAWLITLLWFYRVDLSLSQSEGVQDMLHGFIKEIRLIFHQHSSAWDQVKHILPVTLNLHPPEFIFVKSVVDSLLLTFVLYSKVNFSFVGSVLQFITDNKGDNSVHSHLVLLLSAEILLQCEPNDSLLAIRSRYINLIKHYRSMFKDDLQDNCHYSDHLIKETQQIWVGCEDVIKDYS